MSEQIFGSPCPDCGGRLKILHEYKRHPYIIQDTHGVWLHSFDLECKKCGKLWFYDVVRGTWHIKAKE